MLGKEQKDQKHETVRGLNECTPPKLTPKMTVRGSLGGDKARRGSTLMNGINALIKRLWRTASVFHHMRTCIYPFLASYFLPYELRTTRCHLGSTDITLSLPAL
jgi:hypothetical protein